MQPAPLPSPPPSADARGRHLSRGQEAVLAAVRPKLAHELGKPVRLDVVQFKAQGRWALLHARMLDPEGRRFSYVGTPKEDDAREGLMSDRYAALLSHSAAGWSIVAEAVGPTDTPWEGWTRYGAPAALFQP
ncbi:MAG: hypothetical protein INR64_13570 [Caulobacteraceae bacterium]|nr:hypothetical protein [Caulobacter sp.]